MVKRKATRHRSNRTKKSQCPITLAVAAAAPLLLVQQQAVPVTCQQVTSRTLPQSVICISYFAGTKRKRTEDDDNRSRDAPQDEDYADI